MTTRASDTPPPSRKDVQAWLMASLSEELGVPASTLDARRPFAAYGLSSVAAVALSAALGKLLDTQLEPTLLWDYPSINKLLDYLVERTLVGDVSSRA